MISLNEYMRSSKEDRQSHVNLDEQCIERGGGSQNHKGVLAQFLNTEIYSKPVDLCHACGNGKCSNPRHLYWGTRSENVIDAQRHGTKKNIWECTIEKYGEEKARKILSDASFRGGKGNKGKKCKPKTEEHKAKISESLLKRNREKRQIINYGC